MTPQSGFEFSFKHLDGHLVEVKREGITSPGDVMQMKKEGMPRRGSNGKTFGSLYIRFSIAFPKVRQAGGALQAGVLEIQSRKGWLAGWLAV